MGYGSGYSTHNSSVAMFKKLKENLHKRGECGSLLADLFEAFDCLQHDLLLAKLNTYMGSITNLLISYRVF